MLEAGLLQLVDGKRSVKELAAAVTKTVEDMSDSEAVRLVLGALKSRIQGPDLTDTPSLLGMNRGSSPK